MISEAAFTVLVWVAVLVVLVVFAYVLYALVVGAGWLGATEASGADR